MTLGSFLVLIAGVYRLGRIAATPLVGAVAAALLMTRFDYPFLAARGYIDIPYMALVVWAARRSSARPGVSCSRCSRSRGCCGRRRGSWPRCTGCGRCGRRPGASASLYTALAALGPLTWATVDYLVTGDPTFSLTYTAGSAEDLGRQRSLSELPSAIPLFFQNLVKLPVLAAAGAGVVLGVVISPRRMTMPLVLLLAGVATFVAIGVAGASVIERYLAVPALALMVFAAVAVGGLDDAAAEPGAHGVDGRRAR